MSETIDKQKLKDGINSDFASTTTKSDFYDGMRRAYTEILNDIDDGRFSSQFDNSALITTIESQKEEIEAFVKDNFNLRHEIESLKAITELAEKEKVELFDESFRQKKRAILAEKSLELAVKGLKGVSDVDTSSYTNDAWQMRDIANNTLSDIEKLQNE